MQRVAVGFGQRQHQDVAAEVERVLLATERHRAPKELFEGPPELWLSRVREANFEGLNLNPDSDKLLLFLEQGGACVPGACASVHDDSAGDEGAFDRRSMNNPFRAWNFVYVPYCTGDLHAGDRRDADVDGTRRQYAGYRNLGLFLDRIVPTFRTATQVALAGSSAGGFGATLNFPRTQRAFGPIEVVLIVDSAPLVAEPVLATCQQRAWRETWNLDATVLRDCGADCPKEGAWTVHFWRHIRTRYPTGVATSFRRTRTCSFARSTGSA